MGLSCRSYGKYESVFKKLDYQIRKEKDEQKKQKDDSKKELKQIRQAA